MARIRILELPVERVCGYTSTPFVLVFDRCDSDLDVAAEVVEMGDSIKDATGASGILVFAGEIELA